MAKILRHIWPHQARGETDEMPQRYLREHGWIGEAARRKALALRERLWCEAQRGAVRLVRIAPI